MAGSGPRLLEFNSLSALDCSANPLFSVGGQFSYLLSFVLLFLEQTLVGYSSPFIKNCLGSFLLAVASLPILVQSFYEWPLLGSFLTFLLLPILNGSCYRF